MSIPPEKEILSYQSAATTPPDRPAGWTYVLTVIMAWIWPFAIIAAGVSSDRVFVPPTKKIMITLSGAIIFSLLRAVRVGVVPVTLFAAFAVLEIFVMFLWN